MYEALGMATEGTAEQLWQSRKRSTSKNGFLHTVRAVFGVYGGGVNGCLKGRFQVLLLFAGSEWASRWSLGGQP